MAGLTGKTIAATFESLLKIGGASDADNVNITSSLVDVCDGLNNVSPLSIGTDKAKITIGTSGGSDFQVANSSGASILLIEGDNSTITMGDNLKLQSDSSRLYFGAGDDVFFEHSNDSGLFLNAGLKLGFRDMTEYIHSVSDGNLGLGAGTSIDLVCSTIDIGLNTSADTTINLLGTNNDMAIVYDESAKKLAFDSTDLVIDGTNNRVGIGTAAPDTLLHLYSATPWIDIEDSGASDERGKIGMNDNNMYIGVTSSSGNIYFKDNITGETGDPQASGDTNMSIISTGRVGIGTVSPTAQLHINQETADTIATLGMSADMPSDGDAACAIKFYNDSSGTEGSNEFASIIATRGSADTKGDITFFTRNGGSLERMRIDEDGKVGIGTAAPDALFHVKSTLSTVAGGIVLETTESSDDDRAPEVKIFRNAAVQDYGVNAAYGELGQIRFTGQNSAAAEKLYANITAQIFDTDASAGEVGMLHFGTMGGGGTAGSNAVAMTINKDRVGIGTKVPVSSLDIVSNSSTDAILGLRATDDDRTDWAYVQVFGYFGDASNFDRLLMGWDVTNGEYTIQVNDVGSGSDKNLNIYTHGDRNQLFLDTNGKVGIGASSPACKLQVAGAIAGAVTAFSTAGPTDNVDVSGTTILNCDTSSNNVTIGGFTGGVAGQILYIIKTSATNNLILEHAEGANQNIFVTSAGTDQTLVGRGGWTLVCDGSHWYACSSPTGEADAA